MKRFLSIALCFVLAVTAFILPVSATTSASVVYLVNGNTYATVDGLNAGSIYAPDRMAENIPGGKYFAGWQNEKGEYILKDGLTLVSGENKLIAVFKDYPEKVDANISYSADFAAMPSFDENGENYLNYTDVYNGYAPKDYVSENGESFLKFHNHVTWSSFVYMQLVDDDGAAIQLKKNTKYFVTVTYKLPRMQGVGVLHAVAGLHLDNRDSITKTWQGISQRVGSLIETSDPSFDINNPAWVWTWTKNGHCEWYIEAASTQWHTAKFEFTTTDFNGFLPTAIVGTSLAAATDAGNGEFWIKNIEIKDENYTEPVTVNYYVNGALEESFEKKLGAAPYVPERLPKTDAPDGKYFAGWGDKDGNILENFSVSGTELNLYAVYKDYQTSFVMDMTDTYTAGNTVKYASFVANDAKGEYSGVIDRGGWSYRGFESEGAAFYATASWGQGGSFLLNDKDGNAFLAEPNTAYKITVEYKVADIVTADEVPAFADGTSYSGGSVSISVGIGMPINVRNDLQNKNFNSKSETTTYKAVTDWITEEYVIETGDLVGEAAVVGINISCTGVPPLRTATGISHADPGDKSYGLNKIIVRKVTVEKNPTVTFADKDGNVLAIKTYNFNEKIDFSNILNGNDILYADGTGYTAKEISWYADKELTQKLDVNNTVAKAGDSVIYADITPLTEKKQGQVSFYGFEERKASISGYSLVSGFGSNVALKSSGTQTQINIAPNVFLDDKCAYSVEFYYKGSGILKLNETTVTLENANDWTKKSAVVYSLERVIKMTVESGNLTVDAFSVNNTVSMSGASILNQENETLINKQAIRIYASYYADEEIAERGIIIVKGDAEKHITENSENAIVTSKTDNFDICWKQEDGEITFSNYITDFDLSDTRYLTVRAYIVTADGNKFYSTQTSYSVADIKEIYTLNEKNTTYSFADKDVLDLVKINGAYETLSGGVTLDWTASTVVVSAYCVGEMEFIIHVPGAMDNQTYAVYVDGERLPGFYELELLSKTLQTGLLKVNVGNKPKVHTVEIVRRAEVTFGISEAVSVNLNGELVDTAENDLLIEFIGDSITCGIGNIDNMGNARSCDGSNAYAFLTAKKLGVDWRIRSRSGIGFQYGSGGGNQIEYSWDKTYHIQNAWRSSKTAYVNNREADIVCIYLGTNDNWGWPKQTGKTLAEDADKVVAEMKEMISIVKNYNPNAKIVWINGGMTTAYAPYSTRTIEELGGEAAGYYIATLPENMTGGGAGHPTVAQHHTMSDALYNFFIEKDLA